MYQEYYSASVAFNDPMTSLTGVESYLNNVDMLASRTVMGKFLFSDAGIVLHNVTGGTTSTDSDGNLEVEDILTRWTLRFTFKGLPWKPTARFSGVSIYDVSPEVQSDTGVKIVGQTDYWDSINILPNTGGEYDKVDTKIAIGEFINQIKPGGFIAQTAAEELPYQLLRRGDGYEVRRYPAFTGVRLPYERRDIGFESLGTFTRGIGALGPSLMDVRRNGDTNDKLMLWPLTYTLPTETEPPVPTKAIEKAASGGRWQNIEMVNREGQVVAVREYTDASMEPVVRKADRELREILDRDGLKPREGSEDVVRFAQYDAVYSMGKRRGELWIDLADGGHPW